MIVLFADDVIAAPDAADVNPERGDQRESVVLPLLHRQGHVQLEMCTVAAVVVAVVQ